MLGAGELSRELVTAFQRLGVVVIAVDRYADAPALKVADRSVVIKMTDHDELTALIEHEQPDYVVTEANAPGTAPVIDFAALVAVGERGLTDVVPSARSSRLSLDREGLRRLAADELGLPTAPFWFAGSADELTAIARARRIPAGGAARYRCRADGESVLLRAEDVDAGVAARRQCGRTGGEHPGDGRDGGGGRPRGHSADGAQHRAGRSAVHFCEPIGHRQADGVGALPREREGPPPARGGVLESWQPQKMTDAARDAARSIAARIVNALGGRGVFGVELLVNGDEVYFVDVTARPHDSGLVTLRSQRLSEFELHARAILGLPVDTIMITPGAANVVYASQDTSPANADLHHDDEQTERAAQALSDALAVPESDVRIFPHPKSYPRYRLGLALATAPDVQAARTRAHDAVAALRKFW